MNKLNVSDEAQKRFQKTRKSAKRQNSVIDALSVIFAGVYYIVMTVAVFTVIIAGWKYILS